MEAFSDGVFGTRSRGLYKQGFPTESQPCDSLPPAKPDDDAERQPSHGRAPEPMTMRTRDDEALVRVISGRDVLLAVHSALIEQATKLAVNLFVRAADGVRVVETIRLVVDAR